MTTDVETSLEIQLLEDLDFEPACASPLHDTSKEAHDDGPAKFIFSFVTPCGNSGAIPVCAKFALQAPLVASWWCGACRTPHPGEEVEFTVEPLKGKGEG